MIRFGSWPRRRLTTRRGAAPVAVLLALTMLGSAACSAEAQPELQVLFIGNSYTATNDLPSMVEELAASAVVTLNASMNAPGGWWLRDHAIAPETITLLTENEWDVVVLQEQSMVPAASDLAGNEMFPAATKLANRSTTGGAKVVLFETWGHQGGSTEVGHTSYASMQAAITSTYDTLGSTLGATVAPVGQAWAGSRAAHPEIVLQQPDGSHPVHCISLCHPHGTTRHVLTTTWPKASTS